MGNRVSRISRRQYPAKGSLGRDENQSAKIIESARYEGENYSIEQACSFIDLSSLNYSDLSSLMYILAGAENTESTVSKYVSSESDEQRDLEYGSILDKLGGAISGRTMQTQQVSTVRRSGYLQRCRWT